MSPRLPTWFVHSSGFLLHRPNVRRYNKPPVSNSKLPKWGIKRRFLNTIDLHARPARTGSGRGMEFLAKVAGWCENHHTEVEVSRCYTLQVISILNENAEKARYCPLLTSCHSRSNFVKAFQLSYKTYGCVGCTFLKGHSPDDITTM